MNTRSPSPRLAPIPAAPPAATAIPFRLEHRALIRDGYACQECALLVIADDARCVVRIDEAAGDTLDNLATMCVKCAELHGERQRCRPSPPY